MVTGLVEVVDGTADTTREPDTRKLQPRSKAVALVPPTTMESDAPDSTAMVHAPLDESCVFDPERFMTNEAAEEASVMEPPAPNGALAGFSMVARSSTRSGACTEPPTHANMSATVIRDVDASTPPDTRRRDENEDAAANRIDRATITRMLGSETSDSTATAAVTAMVHRSKGHWRRTTANCEGMRPSHQFCASVHSPNGVFGDQTEEPSVGQADGDDALIRASANGRDCVSKSREDKERHCHGAPMAFMASKRAHTSGSDAKRVTSANVNACRENGAIVTPVAEDTM